jgi:hypothetical protein
MIIVDLAREMPAECILLSWLAGNISAIVAVYPSCCEALLAVQQRPWRRFAAAGNLVCTLHKVTALLA